MLAASKLIGILLALISAAMSLDTQYRLIAATLIVLLLCFVGIILLGQPGGVRFIRKPALATLSVLIAIWLASSVSATVQGVATINISSVINLFVLVAVGWSAEKVETDVVLEAASKAFAAVFCVTSALYIAGIQVYSNPNNYAALLFLPLMSLSQHRTYKVLVLFIAAGTVAYVLDARLAMALAAIIWGVSLPVAQHKWAKVAAAAGTSAAIGANLYFTFNFSFIGNILTTNRVLIWNQYGNAIPQHPWLGWGDISAERAQSVAAELSAVLGRGVNEAYGTQSLYVRYLYENGWVGLSLVLLMFAVALFRANRLFYPLLVLMLAGLIESIKLGAPSIIGLPLTFVFFSAIVQKRAAGFYPQARPRMQSSLATS